MIDIFRQGLLSPRLKRKTLTDLCPFGSTNYSKEALIAEMGAAFLCGHAGIGNRTIDNSAAYIKGWVRKFKDKLGGPLTES